MLAESPGESIPMRFTSGGVLRSKLIMKSPDFSWPSPRISPLEIIVYDIRQEFSSRLRKSSFGACCRCGRRAGADVEFSVGAGAEVNAFGSGTLPALRDIPGSGYSIARFRRSARSNRREEIPIHSLVRRPCGKCCGRSVLRSSQERGFGSHHFSFGSSNCGRRRKFPLPRC